MVDTDAIDGVLPPLGELTTTLRRLVPGCAELVGDGRPLEVIWDKKKAKV